MYVLVVLERIGGYGDDPCGNIIVLLILAVRELDESFHVLGEEHSVDIAVVGVIGIDSDCIEVFSTSVESSAAEENRVSVTFNPSSSK